jgi:hypothetical protein
MNRKERKGRKRFFVVYEKKILSSFSLRSLRPLRLTPFPF